VTALYGDSRLGRGGEKSMPPKYIYKIAMPKYSKKQGGYNQSFDTPNIPTISISYRLLKMINYNI
jgi:hypothetical protein